MSQFDAGSVVATVQMDTTPAHSSLDDLEARVTDFEDRDHTIRFGVDDLETRGDLDDLDEEIDRVTRDRTVHVDIDSADAQLRALAADAQSDNLIPDWIKNTGKFMAKWTAILTPATAGVEALATAAAGSMLGLAGAFGVAGAGAAAFAAAAEPAIKGVTTAQQQLTTAQAQYAAATSPAERIAALQAEQRALNGLTADQRTSLGVLSQAEAAWKSWAAALQPTTLGVFDAGLRDLTALLPTITPLVQAAGGALTGLLSQARSEITSGGFSTAIAQIATEVGPVITTLGQAAGQLGAGLAHAFIVAEPLITAVSQGLLGLATRFDSFTQGPGFAGFVRLAQQIMPLVTQALGQAAGAVGSLLSAVGPLVPVVVNVFGQLATILQQGFSSPGFHDFVTGIAAALPLLLPGLSALVQGITQILGAVGPLIPVVAQLVSALSQALAPAIATVASQLATALVPIASALVPAVEQLAPSIGALASTFGELLVAAAPVVAQLITQLAPQLPGLVGQFDSLLQSLLPLVGPFGSLLSDLVPLAPAFLALWAAAKGYTIITSVRDAIAGLDFVLDASGIGLILTLAAALVTAYETSETFRNVVGEAFHEIEGAIGDAIGFIINDIFKPWVDSWFTTVGWILEGADKLLGWVPGVGGALNSAVQDFDNFRNNVDSVLNGAANDAYGWGQTAGTNYADAFNSTATYQLGNSTVSQADFDQMNNQTFGTPLPGAGYDGKNPTHRNDYADMAAAAASVAKPSTPPTLATPKPLASKVPSQSDLNAQLAAQQAAQQAQTAQQQNLTAAGLSKLAPMTPAELAALVHKDTDAMVTAYGQGTQQIVDQASKFMDQVDAAFALDGHRLDPQRDALIQLIQARQQSMQHLVEESTALTDTLKQQQQQLDQLNQQAQAEQQQLYGQLLATTGLAAGLSAILNPAVTPTTVTPATASAPTGSGRYPVAAVPVTPTVPGPTLTPTVDAAGLLGQFQTQLATEVSYATDLGTLRDDGLSSELLKQLVAAGPQQGGQIAAALAANPALIGQFNATQQQLDQIASSTSTALTGDDFNSEIGEVKDEITTTNGQLASVNSQLSTLAAQIGAAVSAGINSAVSAAAAAAAAKTAPTPPAKKK